jgi:hypothetical protein
MDMSSPTRYQAVREALFELGPLATNEAVAEYVVKTFGFNFDEPRALSLYIAMVKRKMSRKGEFGSQSPSGIVFSWNQQ